MTSLASSHDSSQLAVGYRDGAVRIFDVASGECTVTFNGHRTQVSALNYDAHSMRLVSGGLVCSTTAVTVISQLSAGYFLIPACVCIETLVASDELVVEVLRKMCFHAYYITQH